MTFFSLFWTTNLCNFFRRTRRDLIMEHHELAIFPGGMESKTEITLLTTMAKEGHKRRLASERKKEAERQLEAAKLRKAEQDAKTRLRHEEAARYTQQQRLWWDDEVIHQVAVSKNNYFLEEVRALAPLTCGYLC